MRWSAVVATLSGCWEMEEQERLRRVWEMQDHEVDAIAARDALMRKDLAGAQQAGERLAAPDLVPGLPAEVVPWLTSVREGGQALAHEVDLPSAAARLMAITGDCAGCHTALGVPAPQPMHRTGEELAWIAVVFESEQRWADGLELLGADAGTATTWPERRARYAARLAR